MPKTPTPGAAGQPAPHNPAAAEEAPNRHKRRKIRKGTQSCWECKRRKIRCTFASPAGPNCDGCRSRGTCCLGQEYDEFSGVQGGLGRGVEHVVQPSHSKHPRRGTPSLIPDPAPGPGPDPEAQVVARHHDLCRTLRAVWPSQHNLDLILRAPVDLSVLSHGVVCIPYAEYCKRFIPFQASSLQLPPEDSHPILVARKLLMLATLIQSIPQPSLGEAGPLIGLTTDLQVLESRLVNTASRLVTSNDDMVSGSLDGIECVMLESMYHNNAGSLRRSWLVNRRAMLLAQMMSLHTATANSPCKVLETETRNRIDPEYMWFRLVCTDRYLSLMLGLPQGSPDNSFADPAASAGLAGTEQMERIMAVAADMILQQHSPKGMDLATTHKVDEMLKKAAALMPPKWWLGPNPANAGDDKGAFEETLRLMNQFAYHHLVVQLHLPYILQPSSPAGPDYEYSKMTAAGAARSILERFVSFRTSTSTTAYCRGVDFVAFVASTTLCLSHIETRRRRAEPASTAAFQSLQHQRLGDRGLLERTLEIMEGVAEREDAIARKITGILRPLLAIEDDAAQGRCYHATSSPAVDAQAQESEYLESAIEAPAVGPATLQIEVPHFGTVRIQQEPATQLSTAREHCPGPLEVASDHLAGGGIDTVLLPSHDPLGQFLSQAAQAPWASDAYHTANGAGELVDAAVPGLDVEIGDWALQGVDMTLFNSLLHGSPDESGAEPRTGTQS